MPIAEVLYVVFPVFSIIGAGYLFACFKEIDLGPVIEILLYLTIPALVVSSLLAKPLFAGELVMVSAAVVTVVLGVGLLSYIYLKLTGLGEMRGFYLPTMFMNSGNMGFPLALLAFGSEGLAVAVIFYVVVGILVYSLGVFIAKGRGGATEIFRLPLIYAAIAGVGLNLGHVDVPRPVFTSLEMLGAATIPLMQLSLGYRLRSVRITYPWMSLAGSFLRIVGGFALAWCFVELFGIGGVAGKVIILSSSMPSAVINFIISHRYNAQSDLVASVIGASTLASIVTTPVVLMLIM